MFKFCILISSILSLFAVDGLLPVNGNDDLAMLMPLRRQPAEMSEDNIKYTLENGKLKEKLVTMVRYLGSEGITESDTIKLISSNAGNSNPYSGMFGAYLIALACRLGHQNIVEAIIKYNPDSINCVSSGHTPYSEALEFGEYEIANFLQTKIETKRKYKTNSEAFQQIEEQFI